MGSPYSPHSPHVLYGRKKTFNSIWACKNHVKWVVHIHHIYLKHCMCAQKHVITLEHVNPCWIGGSYSLRLPYIYIYVEKHVTTCEHVKTMLNRWSIFPTFTLNTVCTYRNMQQHVSISNPCYMGGPYSPHIPQYR